MKPPLVAAAVNVAGAALVACSLTLVSATSVWAKSTIRWHPCGPGQPSNLRCGRLSVPLDYSQPHGAKITLGFNRLRAQDRAHRVGSLIVNPGGPGGAGSDVVAVEAFGKHLWHPALAPAV